jgi:hypothetical protein
MKSTPNALRTHPRHCRGCGVPLKAGEGAACEPCKVGHDFYQAALAYRSVNRKPQRRWER